MTSQGWDESHSLQLCLSYASPLNPCDSSFLAPLISLLKSVPHHCKNIIWAQFPDLHWHCHVPQRSYVLVAQPGRPLKLSFSCTHMHLLSMLIQT